MIDHDSFIVEILSITAVCDLLLTKPDILAQVDHTIRTLRAFGRPITAETVTDYAKAMGLPDISVLILSAVVARHLGSEGRG